MEKCWEFPSGTVCLVQWRLALIPAGNGVLWFSPGCSTPVKSLWRHGSRVICQCCGRMARLYADLHQGKYSALISRLASSGSCQASHPQPFYLPLSRLTSWACEFSALFCLSPFTLLRLTFPPKDVSSNALALQPNLLQKLAWRWLIPVK